MFVHCGCLKQCFTSSFCILILFLAGSLGDLCLNPTQDGLASALKKGVLPLGGAKAGNYTLDPDASNVLQCVESCCNSPDCEVMFFFNKQCLLIACDVKVPNGCDPSTRADSNFDAAYYLRVRTADDVAYLHVVDHSTTMSAAGSCLVVGCDDDEECRLVGNRHVCVCMVGMERDVKTGLCQPYYTTYNDDDITRYCTVGLLDQCRLHEHCVPRHTILRNKSGQCECVSGFKRDPVTSLCVRDNESLGDINSTVSSYTSEFSFDINTTTSSRPLGSVPVAMATTVGQPIIKPLIVSAGDNHVIQLPLDHITLYAYVLDDTKAAKLGKYSYQWSLFSHPDGEETGEMADINTDALKLTKLRAGLYTFKVIVSAEGKYGETYVNVTVQPPVRVNQPPVAIVKPPVQEINEPNDLVIDGSASTDDDKVVSYHWEQVSGKLSSQTKVDSSDLNKPMLMLKGLSPGSYRFKLTVTDSDGVQNSTFADATVVKETDYPPTANAGSNVIISLPQNSVTLFGNASTDDRGIVTYEWTRTSDDKLAVDMVGVRTPFLRLDNLVVGDYTFRLKVTDMAGQESTADVRVFVKPEHNQPPVASAGTDMTVWLPSDIVTLDGSNSTDDQKISAYQWTLVSGGTDVIIENADRAVATASKLTAGQYKFRLTIKDNEGLMDNTVITVNVKENNNQAPVADAGGDQVVYLPAPLVILNGSKSTDDRGIVSYTWSRDANSPAAGTIVPGSDRERILQIAGVVIGRYVFSLEVADEDGLTSRSSASLIVKPEPHHMDLVRMRVSADIQSFTELNKLNLVNELSLLLHHNAFAGETKIFIEDISEDGTTGQTLVTFYAATVNGKLQSTRSGIEVVTTLKNMLRNTGDIFDYRIVNIDTVVCQNNCSGHGHCNQATKRCICSGFWMEDFFRANFGEQQSNCDWSILYVIIVVFVSTLVTGILLWGTFCICRRCSRMRPKVKRHRYTLLEDLDESEKTSSNGKLELLPSAYTPASSLMQSESDVSSEETIFVNQRRQNGHVGGTNNNTMRKPLGVIPKAKVTA